MYPEAREEDPAGCVFLPGRMVRVPGVLCFFGLGQREVARRLCSSGQGTRGWAKQGNDPEAGTVLTTKRGFPLVRVSPQHCCLNGTLALEHTGHVL